LNSNEVDHSLLSRCTGFNVVLGSTRCLRPARTCILAEGLLSTAWLLRVGRACSDNSSGHSREQDPVRNHVLKSGVRLAFQRNQAARSGLVVSLRSGKTRKPGLFISAWLFCVMRYLWSDPSSRFEDLPPDFSASRSKWNQPARSDLIASHAFRSR
jgi:hypothetical protein